MLRTSLVLLTLSTAATAQLAITELHLDPAGPNGAQQIVEITNVDTQTFTSPGDWTFCVRPIYVALPQVPIPPGAAVRVHIGALGTDTQTDWFVPQIPLLQLDGEISIYSTNIFFNDPTQMVSFVSWGIGETNPLMSRMPEALAAGLWSAANEHVTLPPEGPSTAAWLGSNVGPSAWYIDTTPTLGGPNNPASWTPFGSGCAGGAGTPDLHPATAGARPWQGTTFTLEVTNVVGPTSLAFLVLSFTETPPASLAPLGLASGCQSYLTPDALQLGLGSGVVQFGLALPATPSFEGITLIAQAVASDPTAASPVQFTVSNAGRALIGRN